MSVKCENCYYSKFDDFWGEYKCNRKQRTCNESELIMGCDDYKEKNSSPDKPEPEILVRSGATFTPSVSDDGLLSWTNDKGLVNPKSVNIKPVKGKDYFTEADKKEFVKDVLKSLPKYNGEVTVV